MPYVSTQDIPTDQWVSVYGQQVYLSSAGDAWANWANGDSVHFYSDGNGGVNLADLTTGQIYYLSAAELSQVTFAMSRPRLEAATACWVSRSEGLVILAAAGISAFNAVNSPFARAIGFLGVYGRIGVAVIFVSAGAIGGFNTAQRGCNVGGD